MSDLILSEFKAPATFNFKDEKLNALSSQIASKRSEMNEIITDARERAERVNRALAPLFGEILTSKCYEKDGFKSVAEYAEKTFNIGRSMAYALARVGRDFYNDDNEYTSLARETLTVSKLDGMGKVDRVALAKAIEGGEITSETSLEDCRAFGATHPKSNKKAKEKVLPTFDIYDMPRNSNAKPIGAKILKEDFLKTVIDCGGFPDGFFPVMQGVVLDGDKASAKKHFVVYNNKGDVSMYEYVPHVTPAQPKRGKKSAEPLDYKTYLASLDPKQCAEFIREALGESAESILGTLGESAE